MILDERNEFADAVSVAAAAGTAVLGDVIDLGQTTNYPGDNGNDQLWLVVDVSTQIIHAGAAGSIQFFLVSDSLATLGSATLASCTEHARSLAIVTDSAANLDTGIEAGTATYLPNQPATTGFTSAGGTPYYRGNRPPIMILKLPAGAYERYLGVLRTISTTTTTAGNVNAFLTKDVSRWRSYANAI